MTKSENEYTLEYLSPKKLPKWITIPFNVFFVLIMIVSITVAIFSCLFLRTPVIGPSMQPTINSAWSDTNDIEDYVLINRTSKGERGDIIVVEKVDPVTGSKYIIKRLIAIGGDKICIKKIDDPPALPTYEIWLWKVGEDSAQNTNDAFCGDMASTFNSFNALKTNDNTKSDFINIEGEDFLVIPNDKIFYLGDNRAHSEDCSNYGPVLEEKIVGRVDLIIPHDEKVFNACFNYFWSKFKALF